jgi:GNAT superfamily N-acetyltransferase
MHEGVCRRIPQKSEQPTAIFAVCGLPLMSNASRQETSMSDRLTVRDLRPGEFDALGRLMVEVYSNLDGFPKPADQPHYYELLAGIGKFTEKPSARVLVAISADGHLVGGVVYFGDMGEYGSGGIATSIEGASGIRLLGVDPKFRNAGAGKALARACIDLAEEKGHSQVILHTTQAMHVAWGLYERLGFARSEDLDFSQQSLSVYGFRLKLTERR